MLEETTGSFGDWVRQRRRALDITQAELARWVGCAAITIRKIEREERRPSRQMAELLAQNLAIPDNELDAFLRLARGAFVVTGSQLHRPAKLPAFLNRNQTSDFLEKSDVSPVAKTFVGREAELAQLEAWLQDALNGHGRIAFVTGEAGRGKTSLLAEFAQRVQQQHKKLVVAGGTCNAFSGAGDPYLPFRDILRMSVGDVEREWASGVISRQQAVRLWRLAPFTLQTLLADGQVLIDSLIPASLLTRIATAHPNSPTNWSEQLNRLQKGRRQPGEREQRQLFEQFYEVLSRLAGRQPLLLLLDDLQWADRGTINLLFHLGRRLAASRILILGAYRPSEIALARPDGDDQQHPLAPLIHELKRHYGQIELDLSRLAPEANRALMEALLDREPNQLDHSFREALFRRTGGHPLFTIELLRALQEQGDLVQNENGRWLAISSFSWDTLPARVEAVIAQRIGRLNEELRQILAVASVEGERFTAQVVAQVLHMEERPLLRALSQELANRHHLLRQQDEIEAGDHFLTHYQFRHALFQQYFYHNLSLGERRLLHGDVAQALETVYGEQQELITVQLAHHYRYAGQRQKAIAHSQQAATRAASMYAFDQAIEYVKTALALMRPGEQEEMRLALLEQLGDLHVSLGEHAQAVTAYQDAVGWQSSLADADTMTLVRLHRKIGLTVVRIPWFADRQEYAALGRSHLQAALQLVEGQPPHVETVYLFDTLAYEAAQARAEPDWQMAEKYARAAVEMAEALDAPVELSLAMSGLAAVFYDAPFLFRERLQPFLRRLELSRDPDFKDVREQVASLIYTGYSQMLVGAYNEAIAHLQEAEALSRQIQAPDLLKEAILDKAECYFMLDNWDAVLEIEAQSPILAQQYPNFVERAGPTCFLIALAAAVYALRGQPDKARRRSDESVAIMVACRGPVDGWWRGNLY
jgi:transcriptional regulator with XRE-family HTH domain